MTEYGQIGDKEVVLLLDAEATIRLIDIISACYMYKDGCGGCEYTCNMLLTIATQGTQRRMARRAPAYA